MVDRFQQVNGEYSGFRRNHAKGVCITGTFESNGEGVALSRAAVFPRGHVPFVGRFALAGGQPYVADAPHIVRSLAILFQLPNGEEWRTRQHQHSRLPGSYPTGFLRSIARFLTRSCDGQALIPRG